jgi:hypothetical protein
VRGEVTAPGGSYIHPLIYSFTCLVLVGHLQCGRQTGLVLKDLVFWWGRAPTPHAVTRS